MSFMFWSFAATVLIFRGPMFSSSLRKSLSARALDMSSSNSLPVGEEARAGIVGGLLLARALEVSRPWETFFCMQRWWGNPGPEAERWWAG